MKTRALGERDLEKKFIKRPMPNVIFLRFGVGEGAHRPTAMAYSTQIAHEPTMP